MADSRLWDSPNDYSHTIGQLEDLDSKDSHCNGFSANRELIVVINKTDLLDSQTQGKLSNPETFCINASRSSNRDTDRNRVVVLPMSCKTEHGLDHFLDLFTEKLAKM